MPFPRTHPANVALVVRVAVFGAVVGVVSFGCSVDDASTTNRNEPMRDNRGYDSNYPGKSSSSSGPEVPSDARVGDEGTGNLRYRVPSDGRIWVRDAGEKTTVYTAKVYRDDDIVVEPGGNKISINGKKVSDQDLKKNHKHRILFDREERGRYDDR